MYRHPPSNIAHWDGTKWNYQALHFKYYYGGGPSEASSVFSFGSDDVFVTSITSVMHFNGSEWKSLEYLENETEKIGTAYRMWGRSSTDMYVGGKDGSLLHWNGTSWEKIRSNTSASIINLWG